ncbi:MAG: hydroxypyruvate reductase [Acidobacteria bacterium]|nr:MAG: hydroxypyruvate reductase [Acidobacteriota bacterium]
MADLKQLARQIFHETLAAIDIPATMQRKLRRQGTRITCGEKTFDLKDFGKIRVVAVGKAAHAMVEGLVLTLAPFVGFEGVVSAPVPPRKAVPGLKYFAAGHPMPNEDSWKAAEAILALLKKCDERTLVFFLLSGGGSALMELPLDSKQTLEEVQQLHNALVSCGASIDEINTVRKHLSAVKGGRLATAAPGATKITLGVSDVPMGKESALASGPTLPDPTTAADAKRIIQEYGLREKFSPALQKWLDEEKMPETPKASEPAFRKSYFSLTLGMDDLLHPAHRTAEALGFVTCCDNSTDDWPVEKAVESLLQQLEELRALYRGQRVALIADGEVSSPVTGNGTGGRNSAFVLSSVEKIAGKKVAVLSAGTDGIDGNSSGAGAVADGQTLERAGEAGLDPKDSFRRSDAFTFFSKLGDAILTGPTGNNLRDLRILLADR